MAIEEPPNSYSNRVNQAAGMVKVQADCLIEDALRMLRDRATIEHATIDEIAADVLAGTIRFGE